MKNEVQLILLAGVASSLSCDGEPRRFPGSAAPEAISTSRNEARENRVDAGTQRAARPGMPAASCGGLIGSSTCDPVSAWPCDLEAGETCDYSNLAGGFTCFSFPVTSGLCGMCENGSTACGAGTTCGLNRCEKYCCGDEDCASGRCFLDIFGDPAVALAGVCLMDSIEMCGINPDLDYTVFGIDAGTPAQ